MWGGGWGGGDLFSCLQHYVVYGPTEAAGPVSVGCSYKKLLDDGIKYSCRQLCPYISIYGAVGQTTAAQRLCGSRVLDR